MIQIEHFDLGDTVEVYIKDISQFKGFITHLKKWELASNITYKIKVNNSKEQNRHSYNTGHGYDSRFYTSRIVLIEKYEPTSF